MYLTFLPTYLTYLPTYLHDLSTWHSFLPDLRKWPFSKMVSTYLTNLPDLLTHLPDLLTLPTHMTYLPTSLACIHTWSTCLPELPTYLSNFIPPTSHSQGAVIETCDIWGTHYNSDNWELEFMTILVTQQLRVTVDSIGNSCDVFLQTRVSQKGGGWGISRFGKISK